MNPVVRLLAVITVPAADSTLTIHFRNDLTRPVSIVIPATAAGAP